MSGYDPETGIYELTATRADYLYSKSLPYRSKLDMSMKSYATLLQSRGVEVISIHKSFLKVKATDEQLWKVLAGKEPGES